MPIKRKVRKSKPKPGRMRILPVKSKRTKRPKPIKRQGRMRILPIKKEFV